MPCLPQEPCFLLWPCHPWPNLSLLFLLLPICMRDTVTFQNTWVKAQVWGEGRACGHGFTTAARDGCSRALWLWQFLKGCLLASSCEGGMFSPLVALQDARGERDKVSEMRPKQINPKEIKISPLLLQTKYSFLSHHQAWSWGDWHRKIPLPLEQVLTLQSMKPPHHHTPSCFISDARTEGGEGRRLGKQEMPFLYDRSFQIIKNWSLHSCLKFRKIWAFSLEFTTYKSVLWFFL